MKGPNKTFQCFAEMKKCFKSGGRETLKARKIISEMLNEMP